MLTSERERIWIPLQGPTGQTPKAPAVQGWASPGYQGVDVFQPHPAWLGLRCDGLVVIDCDTPEAAKAWIDRTNPDRGTGTYVRRTPRGFHFIYAWMPGAPTGPAVGVFPHTDIRAGAGSQIVFYADGYRNLGSTWSDLRIFNPAWLPESKSRAGNLDGEGWTEMPEGRGNITMTAIAGALRKQGMAERPIRTILSGVNKLTMTRAPMSADEVALIARSVCRYTPDPDLEFEVEE